MMWKIVLPVLAAVLTVGLSAMVGGLRDINVKDAGLQTALNFAVVQHNKGRNDLYLSQVAEVIRAQSQVVAGTKYVITVRMAKTPCRKGSENEECAIHKDPAQAQPYQCTFSVVSRPWLDEISMVGEVC